MSGITTGALIATGVGAASMIYSADKAASASKRATNAALSAAELERQTATDTLNYYKERDSQSFALQAQANGIAGRVANAQIGLMNMQRRIAEEMHNRTKSVFWPLEDQIIKEAKEYDTPERREREAGRVMADVESQIGQQKAINNRSLMRMGVNPNSGKFGLENNMMSLGAASAKAAAGNQERQRIEARGYAMRSDAAAMGRGLPGVQVAAANSAVNAGQAATQAAYAPISAFNAQTQIMGNALQNYGNSMSNAGRLTAQAHQGTANMWGAAANGMGSFAGDMFGRYLASQGSGLGLTGSGSIPASNLGGPTVASYYGY